MKINKVTNEIDKIKKPTVIGISGFGGSGKTTFADQLANYYKAPVIPVDSFCLNSSLNDFHLWEIMDYKRLEQEVLLPFTDGQSPIKYGIFSDGKNKVTKTTEIQHDGIIIIEDVGLFRPSLMKYFSYTIWIDAPMEESIFRGKKRDREVWKNPKDEMWDGVWKANDQEYLQEFKPKETANIIIENSEKTTSMS